MRIPAIIDFISVIRGMQIQHILLPHIHGEEARAVFAENRHLAVGARFAVYLGVDTDCIVHAVQKIPHLRCWLCRYHRTYKYRRCVMRLLADADTICPALRETICCNQAENHSKSKLFHKPSSKATNQNLRLRLKW